MAIEEGHFTYNHTFAQLPSVHTKSCKHVAQVHTDDQNGIVTKMVLSIGDFIKIPSHSLSKSSTNGSSIVLITLLGSHGIIPTRII